MNSLIFLFFISILWFIRETKAVLFWFYLWQLKEYHIGRFLDHFRTAKGKGLFLNWFFFLKIVLLVCFLIWLLYFSYPQFYPKSVYFLTGIENSLWFFLTSVLLIFYLLESSRAFQSFFQKKIKKPVLTNKTFVLISAGIILEIIFVVLLYRFKITKFISQDWFVFWLLVFDVLTPVITSALVLIFQPLAVFGRNRIVKRAKEKRENFKKLLVIGITGSYGKTSTKEFLAAILSEKFKVLKTKEHQNSEIGISRSILNELKPEHQIFIAEMGAYNRGGIKLLCDIAKPKIGILTGINEQHMATFGSQENIIKTKYELIKSLPTDGVAFFNAKNKYCLELYNQTGIKKYLYGENATFPGEENILGAMKVGLELGMTEEEISRAVGKIENKFGGIQIKKGINGINIIDATYSANPDGVISHLEYLKNFSGKKIIVMPCLIELGKASKEVHKRIGKKIAEVCDLTIITTKERFKEIKEEALDALFIENPKLIFEKIKTFCKPEDVLLLESRVPNQLMNLLTEK